jgi:hypothetical protein
MQSLNDRMAGCTVFSKTNLVKAYHQILIAKEDIQKTAIATPFGLWEFLFMAFGLRNDAQALQRLKDNILMGLEYVFSSLDDDGVFSKSKEEHWTHLRTLFAILAANGLTLNLEKCVFAVPELDFLGHRISAAGVAPLRDNVQIILDFPKPTDCKSLQRFLGMINFYRRFLPGAAGTLRRSPPHSQVIPRPFLGRQTWRPLPSPPKKPSSPPFPWRTPCPERYSLWPPTPPTPVVS